MGARNSAQKQLRPRALTMRKLSVDLPTELRAIVERYPGIDWTGVAEKALWSYALKLQLADRIAARSTFTEASTRRIGREIKTRLRRRYAKLAR